MFRLRLFPVIAEDYRSANLALLSSTSLHYLSDSCLQPLFNLISSEPKYENSIRIVLRLWKYVLNAIKGDADISYTSLSNLIICCGSSNMTIKSSAQNVWDTVQTWFPATIQNQQVPGFVSIMIDRHLRIHPPGQMVGSDTDQTSPELISLSLQIVIRVIEYKTKLQRRRSFASGDHSNCLEEFSRLIPLVEKRLLQQLQSQDLFDLSLFHNLWEILGFITRSVNAFRKEDETLSMDKFIDQIIELSVTNSLDGSPSRTALQALLCIVPLSAPSHLLLEFLGVFLNWIPHSLFDETFQLADTLIQTLEPILTWEHICAVLHALLNVSTVRSSSWVKTRQRILEIVGRSGNLQHLLSHISGSSNLRDDQLVDWIQLAVECLYMLDEGTQIESETIRALQPVLSLANGRVRVECIRLMNVIVRQAIPTGSVAESLFELIFHSIEGQTMEATSEFALAKLMENIIQISELTINDSHVIRSLSLLLEWADSTVWENVKKVCLWSILRIVRGQFKRESPQQDSIQPVEGSIVQPSIVFYIWENVIAESCRNRKCWSRRLWGLRLAWAILPTASSVMRCPERVANIIRDLTNDWNTEVQEAATILITIWDAENYNPDRVDAVLGLDQPPDSIMENTGREGEHQLGQSPSRASTNPDQAKYKLEESHFENDDDSELDLGIIEIEGEQDLSTVENAFQDFDNQKTQNIGKYMEMDSDEDLMVGQQPHTTKEERAGNKTYTHDNTNSRGSEVTNEAYVSELTTNGLNGEHIGGKQEHDVGDQSLDLSGVEIEWCDSESMIRQRVYTDRG
uniref:Uncharacterized protein n=1 Tax=Spongospora subterranea TaxID=70186 RepID=A0A0H5R4I4_9EUKA|eukprot:CRZ08742.1 hypothetical protein [Spongospora subterranea]